MKEILKPTLCEIKVEWQLPTNWQLLRATPEISFSPSDQRINLYASVQLPSRAQLRLGEKRSSVKEFWFDDELDSCQLGDNIFFDDFQDNGEFSGYWGTDTDISTSDCEQQYDERIASDGEEVGSVRDLVKDEMEDGKNEEHFEKSGDKFETAKRIAMDETNVVDVVKNWREVRNVRLYSSESSTETEDEGQLDGLFQCGISQAHHNLDMNGTTSPPEKDVSPRNCDLNHNCYRLNSVNIDEGMKTTDDVTNKLAHVADMSTENCSAKTEGMMDNNMDVSTTKAVISLLDASDECRHLSNDVTRNDVIRNRGTYNDVIQNDVTSVYITDNDKQSIHFGQNEVRAKSCNPFNVDMNSASCTKKSKENVIDCDNFENMSYAKYEIDGDMNEYTALSDWGSVVITGYIGPDVHRERIRLCLGENTHTSNGISLHQIAAKKFIADMEAILENTSDAPGVEQEMIALSKESGVLSCMTSSTTVDDAGKLVGVYQDLGLTIR